MNVQIAFMPDSQKPETGDVNAEAASGYCQHYSTLNLGWIAHPLIRFDKDEHCYHDECSTRPSATPIRR